MDASRRHGERDVKKEKAWVCGLMCCAAATKSEARAIFKRMLGGVKRLPIGVKVKQIEWGCLTGDGMENMT